MVKYFLSRGGEAGRGIRVNVCYKVEFQYLHNMVGRWVFRFWTHVDVVVWTFDVYTIGGMGAWLVRFWARVDVEVRGSVCDQFFMWTL